MSASFRQHWPLLGLCTVLLLGWLAYAPGLSGGFLFDDFPNLDALGSRGPIVNSAAFWQYITSGIADPTGRPLALLSFLIDARDWPADPAPFLRTNLCLHLLNSALLYALLRNLGRTLGDGEQHTQATALLGSGLWTVHPLFVSTTLYVVQREAMLPATFILLGLLAYARGRVAYARTGAVRNLAWMIVGIGLGTVLAVACKANGVLLPLLAGVLELCIFRDLALAGPNPARQRSILRTSTIALLIVPSMLVAGYVGRYLLLISADVVRPWTVGQRLLTEPRVLLDYLQLLAVPRSISTGLFNDDYLLSSSPWHPWMTLPAILAIVGILALAIRIRYRSKVVAAALLFFFAGHLLESTAVPLELYFEHRNYVPALLLFWPLAHALVGLRIAPAARVGIAAALLLLYASTTWQRATIWGKPELLSTLWAQQNAQSSRAQASAAILENQAGHPEQALVRLKPLWQKRPYDLQIALNYVSAACAARRLTPDDVAMMTRSFQSADGALLVRQWLDRAIDTAVSGKCPGMDLQVVKVWLDAAMKNPKINTPDNRDKSMASLYAQIAIQEKKPEVALAYFNRALAANISPEVAAGQTAILASNGFYTQALRHLDYFERLKVNVTKPGFGMARVHFWVMERQGYWPHELGLLRSKVEAEIALQKQPSAHQ